MNTAAVDARSNAVSEQGLVNRQQLLWETAVILACMGLLMPLAWWLSGSLGVVAVTLSAVVCGAGAVAGGMIGGVLFGPMQGGYRMAAGMLPRMGIPLAFCLTIYAAEVRPLVEAGLVYYLLAIYLPMVAVEAWLAMPRSEIK